MIELIRILILMFHITWWLIKILCKTIFYIFLGLTLLLTMVLSKNKKGEIDRSISSSATARKPMRKRTPKCCHGYLQKYRINKYGEAFEER